MEIEDLVAQMPEEQAREVWRVAAMRRAERALGNRMDELKGAGRWLQSQEEGTRIVFPKGDALCRERSGVGYYRSEHDIGPCRPYLVEQSESVDGG